MQEERAHDSLTGRRWNRETGNTDGSSLLLAHLSNVNNSLCSVRYAHKELQVLLDYALAEDQTLRFGSQYRPLQKL